MSRRPTRLLVILALVPPTVLAILLSSNIA